YNAAGDDAEQLGEINDIVIGETGEVSAVIIGVGGFLGIGEKNVAVNYEDIDWTVASDDTERLVLDTTKEALEAAAAVELVDDEPMDTAATDDQMATGEPMDDTTTDMAAAPAAEPMDAPAEQTDMAAAPAADQPMDAPAEQTDMAAAPAADQPMDAPAEQTDVAAAPADEAVDDVETGAVQQPS